MWKCVLIWWCARLCLQKSSLSETGPVNNSPQTWKVHCVVFQHCSRPSLHYSEMIMPFSFSTWGHPKKSLSCICLQLKSEAGKNTVCSGIHIFVRVHLSSSFPLSSPLALMCLWLVGRACMCELWTEGSDSVFTTLLLYSARVSLCCNHKWIVYA